MNFDFFTKNELFKDKKKLNMLFIIFIMGVILLILASGFLNPKPSNQNNQMASLVNNEPKSTGSYEEKLEKKLEEQFTKITGVGKVEVIITLKASREIVVNKDDPYSESKTKEEDSEGGTRESTELDQSLETVIVNRSDGSTEPIILKELEPEVNGVVIIAEGGDDIVVKNNLIHAAGVLLDVPAHKIEVMKMKD